jgi:hypothetical protein
MVESAGIEPAFSRCQRNVLPLNDDPMVTLVGIEPTISGLSNRRSAAELQRRRPAGVEPASLGYKPSALPLS